MFLVCWSGPGVAYLTGLGSLGWGFLGNILALVYFFIKIYLLCGVFIWIRSTLPRLRADQLMQFAWLILIPTTLGNILLTGLIYLVISGLGISNVVVLGVGLSSLVFLIVTAAINWILLFVFMWIVRRA